MKLKKISKTIITALAIAVLGLSAFGITVNAEEHTHGNTVEPIPIYRLYNPNSGEHFYTKDSNERDYLDSIGWNYEGVGFTALSSGQHVYRVYNPNSGEHHYSSDNNELAKLYTLGWNIEGVAWCYDYDGIITTKDVYRLYNPNATGIYEVGAHHYTADEGERDWLISLGWQYEGVGWKVIE